MKSGAKVDLEHDLGAGGKRGNLRKRFHTKSWVQNGFVQSPKVEDNASFIRLGHGEQGRPRVDRSRRDESFLDHELIEVPRERSNWSPIPESVRGSVWEVGKGPSVERVDDVDWNRKAERRALSLGCAN